MRFSRETQCSSCQPNKPTLAVVGLIGLHKVASQHKQDTLDFIMATAALCRLYELLYPDPKQVCRKELVLVEH